MTQQASPPRAFFSRETVELALARLQQEQDLRTARGTAIHLQMSAYAASKPRNDAGRYTYVAEEREASK